MQALKGIHRRPLHSTTPRPPAQILRCKVLLHSHSVNRRDLLVNTVGLLSAAADAVASEDPAQQAAQSEAAPAAAAADGSTAPAAAGKPAGAGKAKKKRKKPPPRPKPSLKPPGVIPRVKLADNLSVSKVGTAAAACSRDLGAPWRSSRNQHDLLAGLSCRSFAAAGSLTASTGETLAVQLNPVTEVAGVVHGSASIYMQQGCCTSFFFMVPVRVPLLCPFPHRGDAMSDRTSGAAAIEDLDTFCRAGGCAGG
jgi:hypothetical protein